jgi:predicted MFS family arabinose efflux permease
MGYGDLFIAAVLGAVLADEWRRQRIAAVTTFVIAALFDLLFLVLNELPATVPVALALIATEVWTRRTRNLTRPPSAPIRLDR